MEGRCALGGGAGAWSLSAMLDLDPATQKQKAVDVVAGETVFGVGGFLGP